MSNLIPMDKAAAMLGISVDRLAEMRSNGEIHGLRDGTSWKFKKPELERIADELGITLKAVGNDSGDFELSDSSGSEPALLDESGELLLDESSDSGVFKPSGGNIVDDDAPSKNKGPADTDKLGLKKGPGSSKKMSDEDLFLPDVDGDLSSEFEDSEESDLILESSDSGGDLIPTGKRKPTADEELASSDEEFKLGGSDIDEFELSEERSPFKSLNAADEAEGDDLFQDDNFDLTPSVVPESEDSSGSQVIALDDPDIFTASSDATVLNDGGIFEGTGGGQNTTDGFDTEVSLGPNMVSPVTIPASEAPFTLWQVLSLGLLLAIMVPGGMIAYDLCRNLWAPTGTTISSGVLPFILEVFQ